LILGLAINALALYSFSDSWRVGIDREKPGKLVTTGIFAWSRNPVYISLDLLVLGTFLLQGLLIFLILTIGIAGSLHIQILQEEKFLVQNYKEAFIKYCSKTRRYF
jgi:protein-S-isoprenylcysteine O-methyltransferase Ste14